MSEMKFEDFIKGFTEYLNESEIAEVLGVSQKTITLWKNGIEPPPIILEAIKDYFGEALEEFDSMHKNGSYDDADKYLRNPLAIKLYTKIVYDSSLETLKKF